MKNSPENTPPQPALPHRRSRSYWPEIAIWVLGMLAINAIFLSPSYRGSGQIDPTKAGQLGDFVGGFIGQIIALTGLCFLVATFRTEFRRSRRERFETKYFELLQLHRANVEEMELKDASGRKVFVLLLREWRSILNIVRSLAQDESCQLSQLQLLQIAYYSLYFGVGPNSSRMLKASLSTFDQEFVNLLEATLNEPWIKYEVASERSFSFTPFEGHQSRLGHYFRHLFQMVRYVEDNVPSDMDRKELMSTIRAQLSTHEQALLLLNSLTPIGAPWWNLKLIDRYRLVHNIPALFFAKELELDQNELFGADYFEKPETLEKKMGLLEEPFRRFEQDGWAKLWHDGTPI